MLRRLPMHQILPRLRILPKRQTLPRPQPKRRIRQMHQRLPKHLRWLLLRR
jgi:hypothetical protein